MPFNDHVKPYIATNNLQGKSTFLIVVRKKFPQNINFKVLPTYAFSTDWFCVSYIPDSVDNGTHF